MRQASPLRLQIEFIVIGAVNLSRVYLSPAFILDQLLSLFTFQYAHSALACALF